MSLEPPNKAGAKDVESPAYVAGSDAVNPRRVLKAIAWLVAVLVVVDTVVEWNIKITKAHDADISWLHVLHARDVISSAPSPARAVEALTREAKFDWDRLCHYPPYTGADSVNPPLEWGEGHWHLVFFRDGKWQLIYRIYVAHIDDSGPERVACVDRRN